jgi:hypothetical protein
VKKTLACSLGFVLLAAFGAPNFARPAAVSHPSTRTRITVRTQSRVQVPSKSMARAEELATNILREAGIQVLWLNCDVVEQEAGSHHDCTQPLSSTDFVLIWVDDIQALSLQLGENTLGLALVPPGGQGYMAYVSYHHARDIARKSSVAVEKVLGVGAAHELGHLLLGENAHSPSGIMKISWGADQLKAGLNWNMWFTPQQSKRIQSNIQLRQAGSQTAD